MIEISHKQARYLIRVMQDQELPDEQWAILQAHLERCPECSAYRDRIAGLERNLQRELHGRWGPVRGPVADLPGELIALRHRRARRRYMSRYIWWGALVGLVVLFFSWRAGAFSPPPPPTATPAHAISSPTPQETGLFHGLIAYQATQAGNNEIFLLSAGGPSGAELSDLTSSSAEDTDPAWSPDGEWLAFLSTRSGKRELYVINVAGSRLTQLTDDPSIDWLGPLSWSSDGQWIALTGLRLTQQGSHWIYLVPLSGDGPRSVALTSGEQEMALFSPSQPLLATASNVYDLSDGWFFRHWYGLPTVETNPIPDQRSSPEGAFDWALGGNSLIFLAHGQTAQPSHQAESQLRLSPVLGLNNRESLDRALSLIVARTGDATSYRSPTYMPGGPFIAVLRDPKNTGCWLVHLVHAFLYDQTHPVALTGLCVDSPLERASWLADTSTDTVKWLVVIARPADPATGKPSGSAGIYALQIPFSMPLTDSAAEFERLADAPQGKNVIPRVRPTGESLGIQPIAAQPSPERPQALPQTPSAQSGTLLLAEQDAASAAANAALSSIVRVPAAQAGESGQRLHPADASNACPAWSPDGQQIAFLAHFSAESGRQDGIYAMNADGSGLTALTPLAGQPEGAPPPVYGCPAWSPDGKYLAAVRYEQSTSWLVVMDRNRGALRTVTVDAPSRMVTPVWSTDSRTIFLAEQASGANPPYIVSFVWDSTDVIGVRRTLEGWDDVQAFSLSPDGKQMALIAVRNASSTLPARADLLDFNQNETAPLVSESLLGYDARWLKAPGRIVWVPDDGVLDNQASPGQTAPHRLLFIQPGNWFSRNKAEFVLLNPQDSSTRVLASSTDALYDWAYKNGWLYYSSESGLWGQPVGRAGETLPAPVWLTGRVITGLDWK